MYCVPKPLGILQNSGKKNAYRNSVDYTEIQEYRSVVDLHVLLDCATVVLLFAIFGVLKQPSGIVQTWSLGIKETYCG